MNLLKTLFKVMIEITYFLTAVGLIFNGFTDISFKLHFTESMLTINQTLYFGFVSTLFAILNYLTKSFFGIKFHHA